VNIAVVGAGAMEALFGALLAEAGHVVWRHDDRTGIVAAIEHDGITIRRGNGPDYLTSRAIRVSAAVP
jgi:ketopantoate reductase